MAERESQVAMSAATDAPRQRVRTKFYVAVVVLLITMIFVGFRPS